MRILVAEDDRVTLRLLESCLKKWGHEVVACSDGVEAWEILQKEGAPKLAILDWMMPGMNGVDICREARNLSMRQYVNIILLTSKSRKEDVVEGLEAGADDYIVKPFDRNELKVRVRAAARMVRLQEDLRTALEHSEFRASHDPLTRLFNRGSIIEALQKELSRSGREGTQVSVIIGDVDHFKRVNDDYGHLAGDRVLREIAERIVSSIRPYDFAGRYGGEEFMVVLPGCSQEDARQTAERLCSRIADNPVVTSEGVFSITMSFGAAGSDVADATDMDSIIRCADQALYTAKNAGRNRVELWQEVFPCRPNGGSTPEKLSMTSGWA